MGILDALEREYPDVIYAKVLLEQVLYEEKKQIYVELLKEHVWN